MIRNSDRTIDGNIWRNASLCLSQLSRELPTKSDSYVLSNEIWEEGIYKSLLSTRAANNAGHIGVSALQNFDIGAARGSNFIILINHTSTMQRLVEMCLKSLDQASIKRERYCRELCDLTDSIPREFALEDRDDIKDRLQSELTRPGSFLYNDQSFGHIHRLASEGRILNLQIDLTDHEAFCSLLEVLNASGLAIDSFYLSNVGMHAKYLSPDPDCPKLLLSTLNIVRELYPDALLIESGLIVVDHTAKLRVFPPTRFCEAQYQIAF